MFFHGTVCDLIKKNSMILISLTSSANFSTRSRQHNNYVECWNITKWIFQQLNVEYSKNLRKQQPQQSETFLSLQIKFHLKSKSSQRFKGSLAFTEKKGLYLLSKFCIVESFTNIQSSRRFDLSFLKTSKQIYRKLQYTDKVM